MSMECLKRKRNTKIGCGELLTRRIKVGRGGDAQTKSTPPLVRSRELRSSMPPHLYVGWRSLPKANGL